MQTRHPRRPGEAIFNLFILAATLFLLYTAYGISGFEALSAPGAIPMASTAIMVICAALILVQSLKRPGKTSEKLIRDILPLPVVATILAITAYAFLLKPLGFLPTSFLFLLALIKLLSGRGILWCSGTAILCVALIYCIFRLVFSVLMPSGIVPEGEILAALRHMIGMGK